MTTCRVDTAPLIAGRCIVSAYAGHGILGSAIPSSGTHGASILYNDITLPGEASDEFRALILTSPAGLAAFQVGEDGSLYASGPDGSYSGTYAGFKNGVSYGTAAYSFTIGTADTEAPTLVGTITVSALSATGYRMAWPAGADNIGIAGYDYSLNGGGTWLTLGNVLFVDIAGRTPGSTDQLRVRARDAAGNLSTPVLSTPVTLLADTTAPTLSGAVTSSAVLSTTATIAWPAGSDNHVVASYEYSINGGAYVDVGNVLTANLSGLTPSTIYTVLVRDKDPAGNLSAPISGSFTTTAVAPTISVQPAPQSAVVGGTATFTVAIAGLYTSLVWKRKAGGAGSALAVVGGSGAATLSYTTGAATLSGGNHNDTDTYAVEVTWPGGTVSSTYAALTVAAAASAPVFTLQPLAQSVIVGAVVTFTAAATGVPTPTGQWQRDDGAGWTNIGLATAASYSLTAVLADSGAQFRYAATNSEGVNYSDAAMLTVSLAAPTVTVQPTAQSVAAPAAATFTYQFANAATVQAERRANSGSAWVAVAGATTTGYTTPPTDISDHGAQYRFGATGDGGGPVYTNTVGLTVGSAQAALVNPVLFADMLARILPYASECPPQTAEFHLREAATDFFQRTLAWREDLPDTLTVTGQQDYTLVLPEMTTVAKLLRYDSDGTEHRVVDAEIGEAYAISGDYTDAAWTVDRMTASINPLPASDGVAMGFRVALKPAMSATAIPGAMYEQYINHIVNGALATLLALPRQTFTDQTLAANFRAMFELAVARVSVMTAKGFSSRGRIGRRGTFF